MKLTKYKFTDISVNYDKKRIPLSGAQRETKQGIYPYYGAQGVIDHVDEYLYDGEYLLIAEDGENLKSHKQNICQLATGKFWVNNHAHVVTGNERCSTRFLYYVLNSMDLSAYVTGSAQPKLSQANMNMIEVELPDRKIQDKILEVLMAIDNKITVNNEINKNLEEQAEILFDSYSEEAEERIRIGDVAAEILDYTPNKNKMVYLLNSSDVTEGAFPIPTLVENKNLKGHFKKRFQQGDILYSEIRPRNHHYGLVMFDGEKYISSTRLMVIRARKGKMSSYLLYQAILSKPVLDEFTVKTETRSGTFPQGNYEDMSKIEIPYGTPKSRDSLSVKLEMIYRTFYQNQQENIALGKLRDSLLPRLMSGELDVSNVEI